MVKVSPFQMESNSVIRNDLILIASTGLNWESLRNKSILITGGRGFLASYLIKSLLFISRFNNLNIELICVSRPNPNGLDRLSEYRSASEIKFIQHDISQPLPKGFPRADIIIHSASQASPKYYGIDPAGTLLANSIGTSYLLEHAVKGRSEKFLFFSSGEVYGVPIDQTKLVGEQDYGYLDPMIVRSCYAESKRIGETMCAAWATQYGLCTLVVRPFHTYGPAMALDDGRVYSDFVADVLARRDIAIKSDGLARRPFCYISDATVGFFTVLINGKIGEAYNVGNPDAEISMSDLAELIAGLFPERRLAAKFVPVASSNRYLKSPIARSCPSIEKIKSLGWTPSVGLHHGFHKTISSYF